MVEGLLKDVPVFYNSIVSEINYGDEGVQVKTQDHEFHGECLCLNSIAADRLCALCFPEGTDNEGGCMDVVQVGLMVGIWAGASSV